VRDGLENYIKSTDMDVKEIMTEYLTEKGFDGLFYPGECACKSEDLMPCDASCLACEPGCLIPSEDTDFDFKIGPNKPKS